MVMQCLFREGTMNSREELYDKLAHYEECITYLTSKLSQKQKESFYEWIEKRGVNNDL